MKTLTDAQVHQTDILHNAVYNAVLESTRNILETPPQWNIEWIGECADVIASVAKRYFGIPEELIYPGVPDGKRE